VPETRPFLPISGFRVSASMALIIVSTIRFAEAGLSEAMYAREASRSRKAVGLQWMINDS
jgi:hypothetical protein